LGILLAVASGVLVGAGMSVPLGLLHFSATSNPDVRHERTLVVDASPDDARRMCLAAIRTVPNVSINEVKSGLLRIAATKDKESSWPSWCDCITYDWGDRITCDIVPVDTTRQHVVVKSRPRLWMTVVDCGSNIGNVEAIVASLVAQGARTLDS
jgi:hypothetical protein